jgi:arsenate reductase
MEIWFNPACSTCRGARELLDESGRSYDVRRYLEDPPTREELDRVLGLLGLQPWELARMNEPAADAVRDLPHDRDRWLDAMVANPVLIERPIVVTDDGRAVVGRPPERVLDLLRGEA